MPRKTDGDKIDELEKIATTLTERLDTVRKEIQNQVRNLAEALKESGEMKTSLALLKKDCEGFQKWKDETKQEKKEQARRWWAFGPNIAGAIVNVLLSALVAGLVGYFVSRH
jgi:citrate synthase